MTELAVHVCSFMDLETLCCAELTGFNGRAITEGWSELVDSALKSLSGSPKWSTQRMESSLPIHPKSALMRLRHYGRSLSEVPTEWEPAVSAPHPTCLRGDPALLNCCLFGEALRLDEVWLGGQGLQQAVDIPRLALVPLAHGTERGKCMAMGVHMQAHGPKRIGDGCIIGVEVLGTLNGEGMSMHLCFAPSSGRCFKTYSDDGIIVAAQVMPALSVRWGDEGELAEQLEAWVQVTADGGICFCRRAGPNESVNESGEFRPDTLPSWASAYFPSVGFQMDRLLTPMQVSITNVSSNLPSFAGRVPSFEFDATWSMYSL